MMLEKEMEILKQEAKKLQGDLPMLQESLTKTKYQLSAVQKTVKQREKQISQASVITEKRQALAISQGEDPAFLEDNPHLVTLLALFQERDDFNVDTENEIVKPVHEESFLKETLDNVMVLASEQPQTLPAQVELCRERLGDVKNQLLESVKQRWIKSGRRNSICSLASESSKRSRTGEDDFEDRSHRIRTSSPVKS